MQCDRGGGQFSEVGPHIALYHTGLSSDSGEEAWAGYMQRGLEYLSNATGCREVLDLK